MRNQVKKSMGLTRAIMISSVISTAVLLVLLAAIGFAMSFYTVKDGIVSTTEQSLIDYANQTEAWLQQQGEFAKSQANAAAALTVSTGGREPNDDFIDSVMKLNDALLDCYTAYADTELYMAVTDVTTLPADFDPTTRSWYQEAVRQGKTIFTAPYMDTATGKMIITVASPIMEQGQIAGVFGCDITLDDIMELTGSMKLTEHGYPVLIDSSGNFMVHENSEYAPRIVDGAATFSAAADANGDYAAVLSQISDGVYLQTNRDYDGATKYFAFSSLPTTGWKIGFIFPPGDINGSLTGLAITYVVLLVIFIAVGTVVIVMVTKFQLKPLKRISDVAVRIAEGNLSEEFDYNAGDEIGKLCSHFALCTTKAQQYITDISDKLICLAEGDFTVQVTDDYIGDYAPIKESLTHIIQSMRETFQKIDQASGQVNSGASIVASSSQELAAGVHFQMDSLSKLGDDMEQVVSVGRESDELAQSARGLAGNALSKLNISNGEMNKMLDAMGEISSISKETAKIVKTIDDIAFQTNILSLNASVEAARAGTTGKGFSVVADEVRNLAGKSAEAASRTSEMIASIEKAVAAGAALADSTARALTATVEDTVKVEENIEHISQAAHQQSTYIDDIFSSIKTISDGVSSTSASIQADANTSRELSNQADLLARMISEFKFK